MSEDKKEMSKYIGELIKIKFAELSHTIKIIKEKMIKPNSDSIEKLEKKVEKNKLDGQIRGTGMNSFEVFLKDCKKEISELKGFTYNQSNDKWQTIKNIENVLRELKSLLKSADFTMNTWGKTAFNRKLDDIFKKLEGDSNYTDKNIFGKMKETQLMKELEGENSVPKRETVDLEKPLMDVKEVHNSTSQNSKPPQSMKYTDCDGICGFCEIKYTCTNPKREKLLGDEK